METDFSAIQPRHAWVCSCGGSSFSIRIPEQQASLRIPSILINRLSNGNALIVKICWTFVIGLACQLILWQSYWRQYLRIRSIDKLLNLRSNLMGSLSVDCFRCAPVPVALATISWLSLALPVIVLETLSVQIQSEGFTQSLRCTVPIFGRAGQPRLEVPNWNPN